LIDRQLLELVAERQALGSQIAAVKRATGQARAITVASAKCC
jgi:chorismate mutase